MIIKQASSIRERPQTPLESSASLQVEEMEGEHGTFDKEASGKVGIESIAETEHHEDAEATAKVEHR